MPKLLIIIDAPSPMGVGENKKALSPMGERALVFALVWCLCKSFFDYFFNLSFRLNAYQLLYNLSIFDE